MALTEDQIERRVERMVDHADRCLMTHAINQDTYNKIMEDLAEWANARYLELAQRR